VSDRVIYFKYAARRFRYAGQRIFRSRVLNPIQQTRKAIQQEQYRRRTKMGPYHIFCAYGGSGSTFLIRELGAFERPDMLWQPAFQGRPLVEWANYRHRMDLLDEQGYDTTNVSWKQFHPRTDHKCVRLMDPQESIRENMLRFFRWIEGTEYKVFCAHLAVMNFFSHHDIRNVTYFIRHPLHSYGSFCKEERHLSEVNALGGIESDKAIEFWADRWNKVAEDYLRSVEKKLDPVLIRFEFAAQDGRVTPYHNNVLKNVDGSKRNYGILPEHLENRLRSLVEENYFRLYDDWNV